MCKIRVDMSKQSSARDFVELIERISERTASQSPVVRSKCNPNIVLVETHNILVQKAAAYLRAEECASWNK